MSDPLVTTGWLAARLGDPSLAILDGSWFLPPTQRDAGEEFAHRHIPGARFFDIDAIADQTSTLPHMLPSPAQFQRAARELGVGADQAVVVYDSQGLFSAPRVWWSFRAMGHAASFVLDGGLPRWLAEGRPLEAGARARGAGDFVAVPRPGLVRRLEEVRAALASGRERIVDARPRARFAGDAPEPRVGLRRGHMPGASNVPWTGLVTAEGALAPSESLRGIIQSAGIDLTRPIAATCGSGVSAALVALALARLGRDDVAVYDGSWAEWGSRADTPVAIGEA